MIAQNFIACDREQEHLAWFVLAAVAEMNLGGFYASYRDDGWGRAAHDPAMMVALFVYAYWKNDAIEALNGEGIPTLVASDADRR